MKSIISKSLPNTYAILLAIITLGLITLGLSTAVAGMITLEHTLINVVITRIVDIFLLVFISLVILSHDDARDIIEGLSQIVRVGLAMVLGGSVLITFLKLLAVFIFDLSFIGTIIYIIGIVIVLGSNFVVIMPRIVSKDKQGIAEISENDASDDERAFDKEKEEYEKVAEEALAESMAKVKSYKAIIREHKANKKSKKAAKIAARKQRAKDEARARIVKLEEENHEFNKIVDDLSKKLKDYELRESKDEEKASIIKEYESESKSKKSKKSKK
jgi:hypothetical protein